MAFLALCSFSGMPVNAIFFTGAVTALLLAACLIDHHALAGAIRDNRTLTLIAASHLVMILLNYQLTISPDASFAGCWALACLPLAFFVSASLTTALRWRLFAGISLVVLCFAAGSLYSFAGSGEMAAPLSDQNNYATLLYLVLIVWTWRYLTAGWQGNLPRPIRLAALAAFAVLVATVQATQSRTALAIVCVALGLFLAMSVICRQPLRHVFVLIIIAAATQLLVGLQLSAPGELDTADLGSGLDARLVLNRAALAIASGYPLTGSGINTFSLLYRLERDPLDQESEGLYVHNDYLQLLAEGGPGLVLPVLALVMWIVWQFVGEWRRTREARRAADAAATLAYPDARFGVLMALGAVLAHALVNFVLMVPVLALLLGTSLALTLPPKRDQEALPIKAHPAGHRGLWIVLIFAWLCLAQLLLDTLSAGVYQGQAGIPFASRIREDPGRMLGYSKLAERLNGNRGVHAYAQAVLHHQQLQANPDPALRALTLADFRRAISKDPWNPSTYLSMYAFVVENPRLRGLTPEETPEQLLERAVTLDPVFVEAYDAIVLYYHGVRQPEAGYRTIKAHLTPWLEWLAVRSPAAADRYREYLVQMARRFHDEDLLLELEPPAAFH